MKRIFTLLSLPIIFLFLPTVAIATEKTVDIKGLYIGMEATAAKERLAQLLPAEWTISKTAETYRVLINCRAGNEDIFGRSGAPYLTAKFCPGDTGFAILNGDFCEGYITTDKSGTKVTGITLSGKIIDQIYASNKISAENLLNQFRAQFDLPEFPWMMYGWYYISPMGYTVSFMIDKLMDVKANPQK